LSKAKKEIASGDRGWLWLLAGIKSARVRVDRVTPPLSAEDPTEHFKDLSEREAKGSTKWDHSAFIATWWR
jgi:hypothetical protein